MSQIGLQAAQRKMRAAGISPTAIEVFSYYYAQLESGSTGFILEQSIEPLLDPPKLAETKIDSAQELDAIRHSVMIKLNGGLGTSMGLDKPKTLLKVRDNKSFLDLIVMQIQAAREKYQASLPLLLMNSFRTRHDSLTALSRFSDLAVNGFPLDILQNQEPKLCCEDLTPVEWPADRTLEWCPPGHGDIYTALYGSGMLETLVDAGYRYACISNGDNLGAAPDAQIAGWFAASGASYAAELCLRTANDKKGGHLAIRRSDGQLILRDTAQTRPEEQHYFTDEKRHPFFHTNNLWFDLRALREVLKARNGVLGLPLIRNEKIVDPNDPSSTRVIQIESAMGAAIEVFSDATAIVVGRERFLPVKTTNELLLLRSDVYELNDEGRLVATTEHIPEVRLSKVYQTIQSFEQRIPLAPSLREAKRFVVEGDWTIGSGVVVRGDVTLSASGGRVEDGVVLD